TAYGPPGWVADFVSRRTRGQRQYIARTTMAKDGPKLYRVDCSAPEEDYARLSDRFLATLASFRVTDPTRERTAEPVQPFTYIDPYIFRFSYPTSWSLVLEQLAEDGASVRIDNHAGEKCAGR